MYDFGMIKVPTNFYASSASGQAPTPADDGANDSERESERVRKPRTRLSKWLAKIAGVYDGEMTPKTEAEYYLNEISKLVIPDYSEAFDGAVLTVREDYGPDVTILNKDIGPESPVNIKPKGQKEYAYDELVQIVPGKIYYLEINGDGNVLSGTATEDDRDHVVSVGFSADNIGYGFYNHLLIVTNHNTDQDIEFSKSHFTLTTPSVIRRLSWRDK